MTTKAIHACYARTAHLLRSDGATRPSVERKLVAMMSGDDWHVTGRVAVDSEASRQVYAVDCMIVDGEVAIEVAPRSDGA